MSAADSIEMAIYLVALTLGIGFGGLIATFQGPTVFVATSFGVPVVALVFAVVVNATDTREDDLSAGAES